MIYIYKMKKDIIISRIAKKIYESVSERLCILIHHACLLLSSLKEKVVLMEGLKIKEVPIDIFNSKYFFPQTEKFASGIHVLDVSHGFIQHEPKNCEFSVGFRGFNKSDSCLINSVRMEAIEFIACGVERTKPNWLSIPLIRLEESKDPEVLKYLKTKKTSSIRDFTRIPLSRAKRARGETRKKAVPRMLKNAATGEVSVYNERLQGAPEKYELYEIPMHSRMMGYETCTKWPTSQVFSREEEISLAFYLDMAAKLQYGMGTSRCRHLVYEFASVNGIKHPAGWDENKAASYNWFRGFMNKNPDLAIRLCGATVGDFRKSFKEIIKREKLQPENVWSVGEIALPTNGSLMETIPVSPIDCHFEKSAYPVQENTHNYSRNHVTICSAVNTSGRYIPLFLVLPCVADGRYVMHGAIRGTMVVGAPEHTGRMTADYFLGYLHHFVKFTKCSKRKKLLMIMDSSECHVSMKSLQFAQDNGIELLTIPPHVQLLEVAVCAPLKRAYEAVARQWVADRPGRAVTLCNVAEIVRLALPNAFSSATIITSFRNAGITCFDYATAER